MNIKRMKYIPYLIVMLLGLLFVPLFQHAAYAQPTDMTAMEVAGYNVNLPPSATNTDAATIQHGFMNWFSIINNNSQTPVTNAVVSVMSGYDPSKFGLTAFPDVNNFGTLTPGQNQFTRGLDAYPPIPVNFVLGYDTTRIATPSTIPVGGTQQTMMLTVTLRDPKFTTTGVAGSAFHIFVNSAVPGVTVASWSNPANLDQGEDVQSRVPSDPGALFQSDMGSLQLDKPYTFTIVFNVPNDYGIPYEFQPAIMVSGDAQTLICDECTGTTQTITDATLDGNTPSNGAVTFSIAESDHTWIVKHSDTFNVQYPGTEAPVVPTSKDQCKKDDWETFANPSFKNQGDCVSYVATNGKNPPDGSNQ